MSSIESKSFGVYLGGFDYPSTPAQERLLSQWDVVVLNPLAKGVTDAISSCADLSPQVLGRLDIRSLAGAERASKVDEVLHSIRSVEDAIANAFKSSTGSDSLFTAVLLANFIEHFSPVVMNELISYITALGLEVWLEMGPPSYLSNEQARDINMKNVGGIVYRNATIRTDGEQQNVHQMETMRTAMRAVAAQRVVHGPPTMLWETIDDGVEHQYAVTQRSFNWCRYNSALPWIGSASALFDAEAAAIHTISEQPLGALMWMKNDKHMKAHNNWRENDKVCGVILAG